MTTQTARTPQPYDCYIGEREDGYEVATGGVVVGRADDLDAAIALLGEHCHDKPRWYTPLGGAIRPLDDA